MTVMWSQQQCGANESRDHEIEQILSPVIFQICDPMLRVLVCAILLTAVTDASKVKKKRSPSKLSLSSLDTTPQPERVSERASGGGGRRPVSRTIPSTVSGSSPKETPVHSDEEHDQPMPSESNHEGEDSPLHSSPNRHVYFPRSPSSEIPHPHHSPRDGRGSGHAKPASRNPVKWPKVRAAIYHGNMGEAMQLCKNGSDVIGIKFRGFEYIIKRGSLKDVKKFILGSIIPGILVLQVLYEKAPLNVIRGVFRELTFSQELLLQHSMPLGHKFSAKKMLAFLGQIEGIRDRESALLKAIEGTDLSGEAASKSAESLLAAVEKSSLFSAKTQSKVFSKVFAKAFDCESEVLVRTLHDHPLIKPDDFVGEIHSRMLKYGPQDPFTQWLLASASYQDLVKLREPAPSKDSTPTLKTFGTSKLELATKRRAEASRKVLDEIISRTDPQKVRFGTLGPKAKAVKKVFEVPDMEMPGVISTIIQSYVMEDVGKDGLTPTWKLQEQLKMTKDELSDCIWEREQAQKRGPKQEEINIGKKIEGLKEKEQELTQKLASEMVDGEIECDYGIHYSWCEDEEGQEGETQEEEYETE